LAHIANGDALSTAMKRLGPEAPSYVWAKTQIRTNSALQAAYREAIEDRADALADDIITLADTPPPPGLDGPGLHAWVAQLKLRVHAREWTASKLRPKVYGASVDVTVQTTSISIVAALAEAERRVLIMGAKSSDDPLGVGSGAACANSTAFSACTGAQANHELNIKAVQSYVVG